MGDYNNLTLDASQGDPDVQQKVKEAFEKYSGGYNHYTEEITATDVSFGANEVRVGSVEDLARDLTTLIAEGFAKECATCDGTGVVANDGGFLRLDCEDCQGKGALHVDVEDFPFGVHDEPGYDWLGTLIMHVPGMAPDFVGCCDADGTPTVYGTDLIVRVNEATSLDELRLDLAVLTGAQHAAAWAAWGDE